MTKKDFFILLIKIFGLYSLITTLFYLVPQYINYISLEFKWYGIAFFTANFALVALLLVFLIFKAEKILNILKLDKGFEEDRINLQQFNSRKVMQITLIIFGGMMIVENLSRFFVHTYLAFKSQVEVGVGDYFFSRSPEDDINWAISFINIVIGYFLLSNAAWLTTFFFPDKSNSENQEQKSP